MPSLRVFISYSSDNRKIAHQLKSFLTVYGLKVFLADSSIIPADKWEDKILENLEKMEVFIPIITNEFKLSNWTDQESGIAEFRKVLIVPIKADLNPYGFLTKYQAIKLNKNNHQVTFNSIIKILYRKCKVKFLDSLIEYISKSDSFEECNQRIIHLNEFADLNIRQSNKLLKVSINNTQIHNNFKATRILGDLIATKKGLDQNLVKQIKRLI